MEPQGKIEDSVISPSFNPYSSDSLTTLVVAKVIHEQHEAARFHDVEGDDFEFSFMLSSEEFSLNENDSKAWTVFPLFNLDLLEKDEVKANDVSSFITSPLAKLFIDDELEESSPSCSSSEADELENVPSGTFCVWRPKVDGGSQSLMTRCKKSSSTGGSGSGSKKWGIRYLLRRSNSEGKDPMVLLAPKKVDFPKQKRMLKAQTTVHEKFYVQRRAENEIVKRKSYLPYKQNLVGLFPSSNGMAKRLPF